jgi:hypothetical protein
MVCLFVDGERAVPDVCAGAWGTRKAAPESVDFRLAAIPRLQEIILLRRRIFQKRRLLPLVEL